MRGLKPKGKPKLDKYGDITRPFTWDVEVMLDPKSGTARIMSADYGTIWKGDASEMPTSVIRAMEKQD